MSKSHLAIIDADKIHDYIFSPHQLKLIRGGSAIELELNERELLKVLAAQFGPGTVSRYLRIEEPAANGHKWEVVFAGGGTVMVLFDDLGDASKYCELACDL